MQCAQSSPLRPLWGGWAVVACIIIVISCRDDHGYAIVIRIFHSCHYCLVNSAGRRQVDTSFIWYADLSPIPCHQWYCPRSYSPSNQTPARQSDWFQRNKWGFHTNLVCPTWPFRIYRVRRLRFQPIGSLVEIDTQLVIMQMGGNDLSCSDDNSDSEAGVIYSDSILPCRPRTWWSAVCFTDTKARGFRTKCCRPSITVILIRSTPI